MPKRNNGRTVKGKGRRDAAVRSMTSSAMSGATSIANSTINRDMKRSRTRRRINRGQALSSMASSMASGMSHVGKMAYDTGMPMIEEAGRSVGQSFSKMVSEYRVPTVPNNPSWVNLKGGLEQGLINLGLLDDGEIDPAIYFQSVERFLDIHKKTKINKDHINRVERSFRAMPGMSGDPTPVTMKRIFENGITHESIIAALDHGFQDIIVDDLDMDIPSQSTPGKGFQAAREKTAKQQKMAKILNLSRGIEMLLTKINSESKQDNMTPPEIYDIQMKKEARRRDLKRSFEELQGLITTDEELKVLQYLVKKYPQLNSMMPAALKKKVKGKKPGRKISRRKRSGRKRSGRKRSGHKRTGRR